MNLTLRIYKQYIYIMTVSFFEYKRLCIIRRKSPSLNVTGVSTFIMDYSLNKRREWIFVMIYNLVVFGPMIHFTGVGDFPSPSSTQKLIYMVKGGWKLLEVYSFSEKFL